MIFHDSSVRGILAGTKIRTRRIIKLPPAPEHRGGWEPTTTGGDGCYLSDGTPVPERNAIWNQTTGKVLACPHGYAGDRLWVKEPWKPTEQDDGTDGVLFAANNSFRRIENTAKAADQWVVAHDNGRYGERWRSSLFMPRWASRILLEIVDVRVERLQDITEAEAILEGVIPVRITADEFGPDRIGYVYRDDDERQSRLPTPERAFEIAWDAINGVGSWKSNPFVWAISFRRI